MYRMYLSLINFFFERAVAVMKMEGKRPGGRPRSRWKDTDTVRRERKFGRSGSNGSLTGKMERSLQNAHRETAAKGEK